jgi:hypothetical protein
MVVSPSDKNHGILTQDFKPPTIILLQFMKAKQAHTPSRKLTRYFSCAALTVGAGFFNACAERLIPALNR